MRENISQVLGSSDMIFSTPVKEHVLKQEYSKSHMHNSLSFQDCCCYVS